MKSLKLNAFWLVWVIVFTGILAIRTRYGEANPESEDISPIYLSITLLLLLVSLVIRVLIIPKIDLLKKKLIYYFYGLATAESIVLCGVFLYPYFQDFSTVLSATVVLVYFPFFIGTGKQS